MSYHIYTTRGIVLSQWPWREADRIYNILTRDLGLIRATAMGVRKETSKLRGALEPLSLARVSLVRGKEYWRATSAESIERIPPKLSIVKPLALLEKLVPGESVHPELFDIVEQNLREGDTEDEMFEVRFVSRMLSVLGYLKESDLSLDKKDLIKAINNGLSESHLI